MSDLAPDRLAEDRMRVSVWLVKLDQTMRFSPSTGTPMLVVHAADGGIFGLLMNTPFGSDLQLAPEDETWRVIGSASLVYPELAAETAHALADRPATIYERRLYVIAATPTKPVMG